MRLRILAAAALLGTAATAVAAIGGRDTTFSGDGRVVTRISGDDHVTDMLVHRGKMVLVGSSNGRVGGGTDISIVRYTSGGAPDRTFSGDGVATTHIKSFDAGRAVTMQGDKIVVAGTAGDQVTGSLVVLRYRANGALDKTFSGDGKAFLKIGSNAEATGVAIQGDKIVVTGWAKRGDVGDALLARFNTDGTLDTTFGSGGTVLVDNGDFDRPAGVVVPGDRIVIGGFTAIGGGADLFAARFDADGHADPTFASGGFATTGLNQYDYGMSITVQPDGAVLIGGFTYPGSSALTYPLLARFSPEGQLDAGFGTSGLVVTKLRGWVQDVDLQLDGKVVAVGRLRRAGRYDMSVQRFLPNGAPDLSFSGDGRALIDFGQEDSGVAGVILPTRKLAVAGEVIPNDASFGSKFAAARILLGAN